MDTHLIISPKTKVLQLLESYPELEEVLIRNVPVFDKLKNPILRNTIAKVATLQQAATIAQIPVEQLINLLRKEVGQTAFTATEEASIKTIRPDWLRLGNIKGERDIRPMLHAGEHPVGQVIEDITHMEPGGIFLIVAPFITAPLIDKAASLGFDHYLEKHSETLFHIYFYKNK